MVTDLEAFQKSSDVGVSLRRFLIDKHGKVWSHPATGLGEALGYPNPDFDVWSYAIRNLGAVEISIDENETVVSMRSATAHPDAVSAAERFLVTSGGGPVRLRYEIGTWVEETCENAEQAVGRLASALADGARESRRVAFTAKARKMELLSEYRLNRVETTEERFSLLFKKWRLSQGKFDSEVATFLIRFGLLDRTAIVSESPTNGQLVFEHVGTAFRAYDSFDKSWTFQVAGARFADQPDPDYGNWCDRTYRSTLEQRQPRFEFVDAVIQARNAEPYRSRYDRLLLPWQGENGLRLVTGTSYQTGLRHALVQ